MLLCAIVLILIKHITATTTNSSERKDQLIYEGYDVQIHQYSYAVFLSLENTQPSTCGASLVMVQAILTAAHCLDELRYGRGKINAYFGGSVPKNAMLYRQIVAFQIHPKYDERIGRSNLAVAFLERRVPLRHEIKKIPLALKEPPVNTDVFSVGWGKQHTPKLKPIGFATYRPLRGSKQMIISRDACRKYAGFKLSTTMICTRPVIGHHNVDDSGNGLILKKPTQLLLGVLSFVAEGVNVYTNVIANRQWIQDSCLSLYYKVCRRQG